WILGVPLRLAPQPPWPTGRPPYPPSVVAALGISILFLAGLVLCAALMVFPAWAWEAEEGAVSPAHEFLGLAWIVAVGSVIAGMPELFVRAYIWLRARRNVNGTSVQSKQGPSGLNMTINRLGPTLSSAEVARPSAAHDPARLHPAQRQPPCPDAWH